MHAKQFWSLTTVVSIVVCAGLFVEIVHGLGSANRKCWNCSNSSCTAYECFHFLDISDPDSLKEPCDPKKCLKSVVYYYGCQLGRDPTLTGAQGCFVTENTNKAILVQTVYNNKKGDYICGPNVWASAPGCPPQETCPCGIHYATGFGGTPQGRCFTRPCDGDIIGGGEIPTGRDICSLVKK